MVSIEPDMRVNMRKEFKLELKRNIPFGVFLFLFKKYGLWTRSEMRVRGINLGLLTVIQLIHTVFLKLEDIFI